MTATVSAFPVIIDAMFTRWTALFDPDDVTVSDGPLVGNVASKAVLEIGLDDPDSVRQGAASGFTRIEWAGLGNYARDETLTINCAVTAWSGDTTMKDVRDLANTILSAVQLDLYSNPILSTQGNKDSRIATTTWTQMQGDKGAAVLCLFTVETTARLTTT